MTARDYTLPSHLLSPIAAATSPQSRVTAPGRDEAPELTPTIPPMKGFRDGAFLALLDTNWRPAPPFPGATGNTIGENGKDHPRYHAAVRREARRRRDANVGRGWYA